MLLLQAKNQTAQTTRASLNLSIFNLREKEEKNSASCYTVQSASNFFQKDWTVTYIRLPTPVLDRNKYGYFVEKYSFDGSTS